MEEILYIEFRESRSSKLKKAIILAKKLPNYEEKDGIHTITITNIKEYLINQENIEELIGITNTWKYTKILLCGKVYHSSFDYYEFLKIIKSNAGKYAPLLNNRERVSLGAVTFELLPLPYVFYPELYGSFFAFSDDIDGELYFCECERQALENYIRLKKINKENNENILKKEFPSCLNNFNDAFQYKEEICFRCNRKVPKKIYCNPMYGGKFKQYYGWYINQEYYKLGVDNDLYESINFLPEICPPEIFEMVSRMNKLINIEEHYDEVSELRNRIDRLIENDVREQLGFKKIGNAWVSETILYKIIQEIYPEVEVIRHHRPKWLEGLELDIYIPSLKLGFEYQGIQHFKAISHWGGEVQLEKQQEHDKRKKEICKALGIRLICVNYDEPLNSEYIISRINDMV